MRYNKLETSEDVDRLVEYAKTTMKQEEIIGWCGSLTKNVMSLHRVQNRLIIANICFIVLLASIILFLFK